MPKPSKDLPPSDSVWLNIEDFEYLCFNLARELMSFSEPIPDYDTRDNSLLESALGQPRHTFDQKLLYPALADQASVLFYSLIKNHPFKNGNKRIAVMALLVFLAMNKKWITISPKALYILALGVANSNPKTRDTVIKDVKKMTDEYMIDNPINLK